MALIGNRHHTEAYIWLPVSLKRQLYQEYISNFPNTKKITFAAWATGKQPFPVLNGEWKFYLELLTKYDKVWDEQIQGQKPNPIQANSSIPLTA